MITEPVTASSAKNSDAKSDVELSVVISNRNDVLMLLTTIRSCIEEFQPLLKQGVGCEIVICDNSDEQQKKNVENAIPAGYIQDGTVKLIHQDFACLFTAREKAISAAAGKYVVCLDSHMLVGHNMFLDMFSFMERASDRVAFGHAPISWVHHHERAAKHDRSMEECELGGWNSRYDRERKITWKGMPWICRKEFFLNVLKGYGALSQHKMSWGGGDMHIGIKPWLLGYENWAIPCRPGIHLGPLPKTIRNNPQDKYRLYATSGKGTVCSGFLVSCYVLGGEEMMKRNSSVLAKRFKWLNPEREWERAKARGKDEKLWLDKVKVTSFDDLLRTKPWNT